MVRRPGREGGRHGGSFEGSHGFDIDVRFMSTPNPSFDGDQLGLPSQIFDLPKAKIRFCEQIGKDPKGGCV